MPSNVEQNLTCVWMNLKRSVQIDEIPAAFERRCSVIRTSGFDEAAVTGQAPDFVVLEFDYPSRQDLARAATFKQTFASVPMLVVTVQHSEALAVWFFRSKFYDYLVQPLPSSEVASCLVQLEQIVSLKRTQKTRPLSQPHVAAPSEATSGANVRTQLQPALTLVERNYHQRILVTDAADKCGLAPFRFGREFKEQFGMDFREFVLRYRIREACRLLRNPAVSITEVGYSVGFSEPSYFTKMFKRLVGLLPSEVLGNADLRFPIEQEKTSRNYQSSFLKS